MVVLAYILSLYPNCMSVKRAMWEPCCVVFTYRIPDAGKILGYCRGWRDEARHG
jgi:hypothetical protein